MRVSAIDALSLGLRNLRGNPMLILLQVVQGLVVAVIGLAGLVPVVLALGAGSARALWQASREGWNPAQGAELDRLIETALEQWPLLLAALFAAFAVWTVAFLVYCWMQAGVMGQLAAGAARGATAESAGRPAVAADFRVYSWRGFAAAAAERVWKFFWLVNLLACVWLAITFVVVLAVSLVLAVTGGDGSWVAALALGCFTILVMLVAFFALFAWTGVAKAEMVVSGSGVLTTFRRSLALFWRRLGAVLLLLLLFVVGSMAAGVIFLPLSLFFDFAMGDSMSRQIAADVVLAVVQTPISAALSVALSAALVALVRGEH